jgi:hypothetical protein
MELILIKRMYKFSSCVFKLKTLSVLNFGLNSVFPRLRSPRSDLLTFAKFWKQVKPFRLSVFWPHKCHSIQIVTECHQPCSQLRPDSYICTTFKYNSCEYTATIKLPYKEGNGFGKWIVVRYVRLPVRSKFEMRHYLIFRNAHFYFVIDISGYIQHPSWRV